MSLSFFMISRDKYTHQVCLSCKQELYLYSVRSTRSYNQERRSSLQVGWTYILVTFDTKKSAFRTLYKNDVIQTFSGFIVEYKRQNFQMASCEISKDSRLHGRNCGAQFRSDRKAHISQLI